MAVIFGLLTALMWGASSIVGARASRALGGVAAVFYVQIVGLVVIVPFAIAAGVPDAPAEEWLTAVGAGVAYLGGSAAWIFAVRAGAVGIVTTIVATDGAVAAVFAVLLGEHLPTAVAIALGVIVIGCLAATRPGEHAHVTPAAIGLGVLGSLSFAGVFVLGGEADGIGLPWVLLVSRLVAIGLLIPVALHQRPPVPRGIPARDAALMGVTDVAGYAFFLFGADWSIAIASVVASQYAVVTVIASRFAFGERLRPMQLGGVVVTLSGVAAVVIMEAT